MKKPVYYVILALLIGVFLFAAYKVGSYYRRNTAAIRSFPMPPAL